MILTAKTEVLGVKLNLVPLRLPRILYELAWKRARTSAVRGLRLAAQTIASPVKKKINLHSI